MTSLRNYLLSVCVLAVIAVAHSKSKPKPASSYFTICKRGDQAKLNECVKNSFMAAKEPLKNGLSALGLIPLEPLVIPKLEMNQGEGNFALQITMTNFTFNGLSNYEVKSADVRLDNKTFTLDIHLFTPQVNVTGNYEMGGQILVIPIRGNGPCEFNFTELTTIGHTTGDVITRDGQQHINITKIKWDISVNFKKSRSWFYNLFNGDKRLEESTNNFFNENGEEVFNSIKQLPEEAFGEVFRDLSNRVYAAYPISELFPN